MRAALALLLALALSACAGLGVAYIGDTAYSSVFVQIGAASPINGRTPHGSGVVVAKDRILTAGHVTESEGYQIQVSGIVAPARFAKVLEVGKESSMDYGILEADTTGFKVAPHSCEKVPVGTEVFTYGHPVTLRDVVTWGHVASNVPVSYEGAPREGVVLDISIARGNSGGGVFVMRGGVPTLVGIITQAITDRGSYTGFNVMLPLSSICDRLP